MLQILREKAQGAIAWVIVLLVAAAFAFFGLTDYFSSGRHSTVAATVNGEKLAWPAVESMYERVSQQYGQQMGEKALKEQVMRAMVQRLALLLEIKGLGFRVGEEQVAGFLVQIPAFHVEGKFSKEQYLTALAQAAYTDVGFRQELSQDVLLRQLEQGLSRSSFTLPSELQSSIALLEQKRDFGYMLIPAQKYAKSIKISEDEIKSYYDAHKSNFVKPEQVVLEYVELSLEQLASQIKPSKEAILAFYQEHSSTYTTPERVHARHILIGVKEKAETLLRELNQGGDFEKIAKKVSEDAGSAEQGGDLGWFVRGQMVPEFEKVAFELKKTGSIAGPVHTQFGYHLIQLVEHKDAELRPFAEVQNLVEEQLKREKAEALFAEKQEKFATFAFEQPNLAPIAEQFDLKIRETDAFGRQGGSGIAANPEVIKIAFGEELLKKGHNSEPIKLSENVMAVFHLKKHESATQETLAQVTQKIKEDLSTEKAKIKIKEMGESIVKELRSGKNPTQIAKAQQLSWVEKSNIVRDPSEIDRHIVMAAFQMTPSALNAKQPNVKGFMLPNSDYLVLTLNKTRAGDFAKLDPTRQNSYREGLAGVSSQLEYALYAEKVLGDAKVEFAKDPAS